MLNSRGSLVEQISRAGLVLSETVFKLFVSSPGDVAAERTRAEAVVEKLNAEFNERARFVPVLWEDHFYSAHETFQDQIPEAADCDLVIAIFRGRLGSPLPPEFKRQPDGEAYPSGTAYEVLSGIEKRRNGAPIPDIYVFRYPHDPRVSLDDPQRHEIEKQWTALKIFVERWLKASTGEFIAGFQTYESSDDFAEQVERCLRDWLAKQGILPREVWDRARLGSPFLGLAAFEADRAHVFFGRDIAIRQATERLRAANTPFLLILGASGAGKSSLLRAGLLPKLTQPGAIPEVDLFRPVVMTPGLDPFVELARTLIAPQSLGEELAGGRFADVDTLSDALRGDPKTAAGVIGEALDRAAEARRAAAHFDKPRPARIMLALDQTERLFTEASTHADAFGALLQALAGRVAHVILAMRVDAYARFQVCAPLLALRTVGANFDLLPPTTPELEDIVNQPVAACEPPLAFGPCDPSLAERLVEDAKGGDALPLLQMTLEALYKAQEARDDGILRAEDYKGMAAAVSDTANAAMKSLGERGRRALEALVAALVADVAADPITGEPAPVIVALDRDAFLKGRPDREALVNAFVEARLLTLEGGARVRPTHDALLRIWPVAAQLFKEMGPLIRARHALLPLAQAWVEAAPLDKPKSLEIPAPLLASGQQLEARFGDDLGMPLRPFLIQANLRNREKNRERLFFYTGAVAFVLLTVFGVAALPLIPLGIFLFGMQTVFARLRRQFSESLGPPNIWREHAASTAQRVLTGVLPGSLFVSLVIALPYHAAWVQLVYLRGAYDEVAPLGTIFVEILYATLFGACVCGFLTQFFAQVRLTNWKAAPSSSPSKINILTGSIFGGVLSGVVVVPIAILYFGRLERPEMTPLYLLPGIIIGSAVMVFSLVNELYDLSIRRVLTGILAVFVAMMSGLGAAAVIFGALYFLGVTGTINTWTEGYVANGNSVELAMGAIYGIPIGLVIGVVIGLAILLTERWSGTPVGAAAKQYE